MGAWIYYIVVGVALLVLTGVVCDIVERVTRKN